MTTKQTMAELWNTSKHTTQEPYLRETRERMESGDPEASDLTASDASSASVKSLDGYSPSNEPTTSGSSSDSDEDSSQDMEQTIEYLRLKQGILKRASTVLFDHEEAYNASTAKTTSQTTKPNASQGSLWTQAKGMVPPKPFSSARNSMKRSGPWSSRGNKKIVKPNPRDPTIDLDNVGHVDATSFDGNERQGGDTYRMSGFAEVAFPQGQWMAQGLIRSSDSFSSDAHSSPEQCQWRVISDPLTCSLGLVPPASISMQHGITIEDALAISHEPRLLTQATPPFCVVYANKAFMLLAAIRAKEALIGKPVESILHVRPEVIGTPRSDPCNDFVSALLLRSVVAPSVSGGDDITCDNPVPCRMMIVPVMNHPKRQAQDASSSSNKRHRCMTHVLIRVHDSDKAISPASTSTNQQFEDLFTISDSENKKGEASNTSSSTSSPASVPSHGMGTVG